jgi:hypothetical protein
MSNPVNLSSSTASGARNVMRRAITRPNTGVRKRTSSAHKVRADATMEGSEKLVTALTDISNSKKEMESRKIDLQKEIHAVNLDYKRERDRTVAENTRISLLHQSVVVTAISNLAEALGGLNQRQTAQPHSKASTPLFPMAHTSTAPRDSPEGT